VFIFAGNIYRQSVSWFLVPDAQRPLLAPETSTAKWRQKTVQCVITIRPVKQKLFAFGCTLIQRRCRAGL